MKCYQCNNNAMYTLGPQKTPLCLHCYALLQQTIQKNTESLREEINYIMDSVDASLGFGVSPRYPTKQPVLVTGSTVNNNHIAINDSYVGVVNTGNVQNLNQTIDSLNNYKETTVLADNIKSFSQAVLNETDLTQDQKNEVLESLDVITKELFQKPENRKKTVVSTLFGKISSLVGQAADAVTVWQVLHPLLQRYF